jgi:hypothetical protein
MIVNDIFNEGYAILIFQSSPILFPCLSLIGIIYEWRETSDNEHPFSQHVVFFPRGYDTMIKVRNVMLEESAVHMVKKGATVIN